MNRVSSEFPKRSFNRSVIALGPGVVSQNEFMFEARTKGSNAGKKTKIVVKKKIMAFIKNFFLWLLGFVIRKKSKIKHCAKIVINPKKWQLTIRPVNKP